MDASLHRNRLNNVATLLMRSRMMAVAFLTLAAVDVGIIGGRTVMVAASTEQMNGDQLAGPSADSAELSWRGNKVNDRSRTVHLPFAIDDEFAQHYPPAAESDPSSVRQPETRRAPPSGLRLIGLGKRPSGAGGGSNPLRYIGLGRKRGSAIKYIGLGRRSDEQQHVLADTHGAEAYEEGAAFHENNDDSAGSSAVARRRRDVAMRLIGIGRRSDNYHSSRPLGSRSMVSPYDEDFSEEDRPEIAELGSFVGLPWHQLTRRAGGDGPALRRMQLRRWSASSSAATGSHVDPALLAMGIGK